MSLVSQAGAKAVAVAVWHVKIEQDGIEARIGRFEKRVSLAEGPCDGGREAIVDGKVVGQDLTLNDIVFHDKDRSWRNHNKNFPTPQLLHLIALCIALP